MNILRTERAFKHLSSFYKGFQGSKKQVTSDGVPKGVGTDNIPGLI